MVRLRFISVRSALKILIIDIEVNYRKDKKGVYRSYLKEKGRV